MRDLEPAITELFARSGPIAAAKRGFRSADNQTRLAAAIAKVFRQGWLDAQAGEGRAVVAIAEAATGTGKTLAGLVAAGLVAAETGERVLVTTYTLALQRQYFGDTLPGLEKPIGGDMKVALDAIEAATGKRLSVAVRKGMRNFAALSRIEATLEEISDDIAQGRFGAYGSIELADRILQIGRSFLEFSADALRGAGPNDGMIDEFWRTVTQADEDLARRVFSDAAISLDSASPEADRKAYFRHVASAKEADILVVPHVFAVMHAKYSRYGSDILGNERPIAFALFDEADRLPDAAESFLTSTISLRRLVRAINQSGSSAASVQEVAEIAARLDMLVSDLHAGLVKDERVKMGKRAREAAARVCETGDFYPEGAGGTLFVEPGRSYESAAVEDIRALFLACRKAHSKLRGSGELRREIYDTALGCEMFLDAYDELGRIAAEKDEAGRTPERIAAMSAPVICWSPQRRFATVGVRVLQPARLLSRLWNGFADEDGDVRSDFKACFFMSASMSSNSSEDRWAEGFKSQVGIFDAPATAAGEKRAADVAHIFRRALVAGEEKFDPKKFGTMTMRIANPEIFPTPTQKEGIEVEHDGETIISHVNKTWLRMVEASILNIVTENAGTATLVLTPTKQERAEIVRNIGGELARHGVLLLDIGKTADLAARFREAKLSGRRVVWLSASAWEGIDLPGIIDDLVITRIPRPPIDGATKQLARRLAGARAESVEGYLHKLSIAKAFAKTRQGIGRGIRKADDVVRVTILDPRFPIPRPVMAAAGIRYDSLSFRWAAGLAGALPIRFRREWENEPHKICQVYTGPFQKRSAA
jgi:ATP-dependent DNA helicase DinG